MSKSNENKLVPKIRFPEFVNDKEWEEDELGELSSFFKGRGLAKNDIVPNGKNPCIHYGELFTKYSEVIKEVRSYTNISDGFKSEANDVLMPTSDVTPNGLAKASCIKLDEIILGGDILVIRLKPLIDGEFLSRFIRHREREVLKLVSGTTVFHLYGSSFEKFRLIYQPIKEQQKIAACLLSLDEIITAESQKLELLMDHKKGLLQNLLPQEGEIIPKFRFKEFEYGGEWEEKGVGNLFKFKQGVQVSVENQFLSKKEGMVRFIRIIDITNSAEPHRYIGNPGDEHVINENDLFMIRYGTPGLISIGFEGVIANNLFRLIWKDDKLFVPKFWFYAFHRIEKLIYNLSSSSSMPAISFSTMEGVSLKFPNNSNEQQKIADTLSSVDELINAQFKKIEVLKLHKKGLLQGLFPDVNEINE